MTTEVSTSAIERVRLDVSDGTSMLVHVARPVGGSSGSPAMMVFQEAFGVNDYLHEVMARCAGEGFTALAPEFYHRGGDGIVGDYARGIGPVSQHSKAVTAEGIVADVRAAFQWLVDEAQVAADRVATIGFCMGGRVSYLANAHLPLAAAISLYGGRIPAWGEYASQQHAPLLMFWGGIDHSIPVEQQREVADLLTAGGARHTQVVFSEADHQFFNHRVPEHYGPTAARLAWSMSLQFLRDTGVLR